MDRHCCSCIFLLFLLYVQEALLVLAASRLHCEMLPAEECAFAVDSSGKRCVLREQTAGGGQNILICQTSNILVGDESPMEYIENEQCVKACGVEKMTVGFGASTYLYRDGFLSKLCSGDCKRNCPNLVDLYSTLAMVVEKQAEFSTHTDLCVDWMHKASNLIRFS